ncbi:MAG TPA: PH domain-containing protein [Streptosporangiaceae bacterium]|nr:PH domain-containing protein [Streptosporangiaceae bacterium]
MAGSEGLAPGEELVLRFHPHAKTLVRPAALLLVIVAAVIVAIILLPLSGSHLWPVRVAVGGAALLAGCAWFGVPFLKWRTTTYELTNRRLRLREGIVSRSGRDFPLNRISDVSFRQGLIDRLFGCGQLIVESPGEQGQLILSEIPDVRQVQGTLFRLVEDESVRAVQFGYQDQSGY